MIDEIQGKIDEYALQVMNLARDVVIVNMRFLDVALSKIHPQMQRGLILPMCNGSSLFYDSNEVLKQYQTEQNYAVRLYLHILLHWIFHHAYQSESYERELWSLSCDIAIENIIIEMNLKAAELSNDSVRMEKLKVIKKNAGKLTAEKIYRNFLVNPLSEDGEKLLKDLFVMDDHRAWEQPEKLELSLNDWKKIGERVKADLKSFSKDKNHSESLSENLEEITKEQYHYKDILSRFTVLGEDIAVNDDEFDYIYYMYGLEKYGNMPLVEPLEYKDVKKVKEFAIVLDTSASCQGNIVRCFLKKTYGILKENENFFSKMNIHIIQCDNEVQSDTKIVDDSSFEEFLKNGKLSGFGGTDFRPAFQYVDHLIENGDFENFKGLIYFTDGFGIYPEKMPEYDAMFVFLDEDDRRMQVPPWAIKVVLGLEEMERTERKNAPAWRKNEY